VWLGETAHQFDVLVSGWELEYLSDRARQLRDTLGPDAPAPPPLLPGGTKEAALATTGTLLGWLAAADAKPASTPAPRSRQNRKWTQSEVDQQIERYKTDKGYHEAVVDIEVVGSKQAAGIRKLFGRNTVRNAIGCSGQLVSRSKVWQTMRNALGIEGPPRQGGRRKGGRAKMGIDLALEEKAISDGDTAEVAVLDRETARLIETAIRSARGQKRKDLETVRDRHSDGLMSDDQARKTVDILLEG
jgi:hypothetical protein